MTALTLSPRPVRDTTLRPDPPTVYVDGNRRRDLKVLTWDVLGPPVFGRVALLLHSTTHPTRSIRMERPDELPPIGADVRVRPRRSSEAVDFQGKVVAHRLVLDEDGERLGADVEHGLSQALAAVIASRWHANGSGVKVVKNVLVRFNAERDGLASATSRAVGSRWAHVFDASASARRWTAAEALAYVIATAVPSNVRVPSLSELGRLGGRIDPGTVDITGLTVAEALARIAGRAGLEVRAARQGLGIELYQPGAPGRPANVSWQRAGGTFARSKTNLWKGHLVIRRRPAHRSVLALEPGWDPALETSRWRDFARGHSPNWPLLADVYRKWVLNEHGWYSVAPWNLPAGDFSGISAEDFLLSRPRQLLPCLSCDLNGASLGVAVEVRCAAGDPWRPWRGPVWVSRDECAVYLGGEALPGEFFQAAVSGDASVRVTATIEADARLTVELAGDPNQATVVVDASHIVRWQKVHASSAFAGREDLGPPDERDDSDALVELAQRHSEVVSTALRGTLTLGWVDVSCHVGDTVEQVKNRAIELRPSPDRLAFVRAVRHDFGPAQCTMLELEG